MHCFKPFYRMQVAPDKDGNAVIASCYYNQYLPGNRFVVKEDLASAWNSRQFRFQRQLALDGDGGLCFEAECGPNVHARVWEEQIVENSGYVPLAIRQRRTKLDYLPLLVVVYPSFSCNNHCSFCFFSKKDFTGNGYRLKPHFISELKTLFFPRAEVIVINGGEPFSSAEGWDLMEWLIASNLKKRIMLKTNGVLLEKFGIERLIARGVESQITLFGMREDTYRSVTGTDNFGRVMGAIETFLALGAGGLLEFTFVISDQTAGDAEDFCRFIERHPQVKGILWNEAFHGVKHQKLVLGLKKRFVSLMPRLRFCCVDESFQHRWWRARYFPIHGFKYWSAMKPRSKNEKTAGQASRELG